MMREQCGPRGEGFSRRRFLRENAKLHEIWPEPSIDNLIATASTEPESWSLWLAAWLIRAWGLVLVGLVVAFLVSFYFSANTVIYAIMRKRVDGTPLDEVHAWSDETANETIPAETPSGTTEDEAQSESDAERSDATSE